MIQHSQAKAPMQITGRMVLMGFIAFFGVIAAVNGVFMYMALDTWPGLTTQDAYKKGLNYNQTLNNQEMQRKLGWSVDIGVSDGKSLTINIADRNKIPMSGLDVEASVSRPLGDETMLPLSFSETLPGTYVTNFQAPLPGRWKVDVKAVSKDGAISRTHHEFMAQP